MFTVNFYENSKPFLKLKRNNIQNLYIKKNKFKSSVNNKSENIKK